MIYVTRELPLRTQGRDAFINITDTVRGLVEEAGVDEGSCLVYVPHTTAGVTINEAADPDVRRDMIAHLDRSVPWVGPYRHGEGNSAAHIKTSLMGSSVLVPIHGGRLTLGTWQGVYFCEFDGPRSRKLVVQVSGLAST